MDEEGREMERDWATANKKTTPALEQNEVSNQNYKDARSGSYFISIVTWYLRIWRVIVRCASVFRSCPALMRSLWSYSGFLLKSVSSFEPYCPQSGDSITIPLVCFNLSRTAGKLLRSAHLSRKMKSWLNMLMSTNIRFVFWYLCNAFVDRQWYIKVIQ